MIEIPSTTKQLLDKIITDQEGGWKLTSNANDPDGGWTYAGVTAETFSHFHSLRLDQPDVYVSREEFELELNENPENVKEDIYDCYFDLFIQPLQLEKLPSILQGPVLSCAINRGVSEAVKILQGCVGCSVDGKMGSVTLAAIEKYPGDYKVIGLGEWDRNCAEVLTKFLREWTRSYIHLVVENAKAWWSYAHSLDAYNAGETPGSENPPAIFRAGDLEGWFNRVEYWRGQ